MQRFLFILAMAVGLLVALPHGANAAYPERPVTLIVPYPPGGNADIAMRILADCVEKELGNKLLITPMPGAASILGVNKGLTSKPDGYTLVLIAQSTLSITSQLRKTRFTWETPEYICTVASPTLYLGIRNDYDKFSDMDGFIKYAIANPGALNVAQIGLAGVHQLAGMQIAKSFGIKFQTVPFDGGPPTVSAVLGKHADLLFTDNFNPSIKPIVITAEPSKHYPGVKTLTELGHPETATGIYYTLAAPKGTPPAVLEKLEAAFARAVTDPRYVEVLDSLKWSTSWRDAKNTRAGVQHEAQAVKNFIDEGLFTVSPE